MKKIILLVTLMLLPNLVFAINIEVEGKEYEIEETIDIYIDNSITKALIKTEEDYEIIGNENLKIGNNEITILTPKKEYKINLVKNNISDNNYLESLAIKGYPLGFDKEKTEYEISIKEEDKLNITYYCEDNEAEVNITGNNDLKQGDTIRIQVIAQTGSLREYKILIKNAEKREEIEYINNDKIDNTTKIYGSILITIILIIVLANIFGK